MTLRRLLFGSFALLAIIACALAAQLTRMEMAQYAVNAEAGRRLETLRALSEVPRFLSLERGASLIALGSAPAGGGSGLGSLPQDRQQVDAAFAAARDAAIRLAAAHPDAAEMPAALERAATAAVATRRMVDQRLALPPAERGNAPADTVQQYTAVVAQVGATMRDLELRILALNGNIYRYLNVANDVMALREVAGTQTGALLPLLTARRPVTPDQAARVTALQGQIDQVWTQLAPIEAAADAPPALAAAVAAVRRIYVEAYGADRRRVISHFATGDFPEDAATFRNRVRPSWDAIIALRDAAYATAADIAAKDQFSARLGVIEAAVATILVLAITAIVLLLVVRRIIGPLQSLAGSIARVAEGDLSPDSRFDARRDEIGILSRAIGVLRQRSAEARALEEERAAAAAARDQRASALETLVRGFEAKAAGMVQALSGAATAMTDAATGMAGSARQTSAEADTVAKSAGDATRAVATVAEAAEALTASINAIGEHVSQSATVTAHAVSDARRTDGIVRDLAGAADRIGDVVGLISSIAGQTNLLALNATIEAARAGEAGKGFAVVASEVKSLAGQTARATEDIGRQIAAMQAATAEVVEAIRGITTTIEEVSGIATAIAGAIGDQRLATEAIGRTVRETADATGQIDGSIGGVRAAASGTGEAAQAVLAAAKGVADQAQQLTQEVASFVGRVRAA